jgi:hypothetical protein
MAWEAKPTNATAVIALTAAEVVQLVISLSSKFKKIILCIREYIK